MKKIKGLHVTGALVGLSLLAGASAEGQSGTWLANDLVGMKVVSPKGEDLGKIEDIVVHPGGEVSYAVLSFGGWMGMGDKLFAMPWSVLHTTQPEAAKQSGTRTLVLALDKEQLKSAPGFDKKNWPSMANPAWAKDVDAFYLDDRAPNAKKPVEAAARTSVITWRASELKGTKVKSPDGEKLGDLREIAIDTKGRVSYVVLSVGGVMGMGDRLVAVPWGAMVFSLGGDKGDTRLITLASTVKKLEQAPEFKEGKEHAAEMCDPEWIRRVYDYFSEPEYTNSTPVRQAGF